MSNEARIRVLCVDDHPLFREAIALMIKFQSDMLLVGEASSGSEAVRKFKEHRPDVTLMDLRLPDMSGVDTIVAIRTETPDAKIVMLTTFEGDAEAQRALEAGASAYLLKSMPPKALANAIRQVHAAEKQAG
jgi:DNA-binding NarL/FixJ family response regulator